MPATLSPSPASLLSTAEVARMLGLLPQSVRRWRMTGYGPAYFRLGGPRGRVVYRNDDVEAWLAARRFTSTSAETVARTS